jgi:indolepyruvate ferredoxin oxidoreductase beta subunit
MADMTNILLVGVGGQGTLLAADLVSLAGMAAGLDVTKSEVHGMAQRGGSVSSHVRWGPQVHSPLITPGEVDYLVAFERLEAVRCAHWLRPGGTAVVNDYRIPPVSVNSGAARYPSAAEQRAAFAAAARYWLIPAMTVAQALGDVRVNNVVMLGALASLLPLPAAMWRELVAQRVPERYVALNCEAFDHGIAIAQDAR